MIDEIDDNVVLFPSFLVEEDGEIFVLGDERAPSISLTTQDSYMPKGNSVFSPRGVLNLDSKNGPWKVSFAREGTYRFTLSRYPLYTDLPIGIDASKEKSDFDAKLAKLSVAGEVVQKPVSASDSHVVFELDIEAGDTDLQTWLISSDGIEIPSYFVDIEILKE